MNDEQLERRLREWMSVSTPSDVPPPLLERARSIGQPRHARGKASPWFSIRLLAQAAAVVAALAVVAAALMSASAIENFVRTLGPGPSVKALPSLWPSCGPPLPCPLTAPQVNEGGRFTHGGLWARYRSAFYLSVDGGKTWQTSTIQPDPLSVFVLDANHAWTVTMGAGSTQQIGDWAHDVLHVVVNRTADAGRTWQASTIPGNFADTAPTIVFADSLHGFAVMAQERLGPAGAVMRTDDGGATWQEVANGVSLGRMLAIGPDGETLWAGADAWAGGIGPALLQRSLDGGATWRVVALPGLAGARTPGSSVLAPPVFFDSRRGVVGTSTIGRAGPQFFRTADGGLTWTATAPLAHEATSRPATISQNHWLVASSPPSAISETTDAGRSWKVFAPNGLPSGIDSLTFSDEAHGIATVFAGNGDMITSELYATSDGGRSWLPVNLDESGTRK